MALKFIHTSDWQLGMTRAFLTAEASARFSQDRIDAIHKLGELAIAHDASFIVVAGDVFESNQLSRETLLRTLDQLKRLPVPAVLLPGNHDPLDGSSILRTDSFVSAGDQLVVLDDMDPKSIPGVPGVEVVGAPWTTKRPTGDLCSNMMAALEPTVDKFRVAVCHGQVDTISPDPSLPGLICLSDVEQAISDGLIDYCALGDRHSVTELGQSGRVWYSGAPVATDFTEDAPNHALLVALGSDHCQVTPLEVGAWRFIAEHFHVNTMKDVDHFVSWLDWVEDPARTVIKVSFEGAVNLVTAAALEAVMIDNAERFASLRGRERLTELAIVSDELDEDSVTLSGYAKTAWNELLASAQAGDETARDALMLFFRLSRRETLS